MINKKDAGAIFYHLIGIVLGLLGIVFINSTSYHIFYIIAVSVTLILSVVIDRTGWIRPYSYLILSFFVFVWMRYILNILFGTEIISIGNGINTHNTNLVAIWLGIAMHIICIICIISGRSFSRYSRAFFTGNSKLCIPHFAEKIILFIAISFFAIFILDSYRKINIVQAHNYLDVSESALTQGYRWFSLGKWTLLVWIILGKDENRFFKGSTIMLIAGIGYLMRGARGYAIMYMFLWLLFFSQKKKIKILSLAIVGVGLLYLANFVLSYRLGWSVASGFMNIIKSTLFQQGASLEPVFGSVIYRDNILKVFSPIDLLFRNDYGIVVDRVRGINWESGGFGSSFFGESYFLGFPLNIIVLVVVGLCVGFVECAYQVTKSQKNGRISGSNRKWSSMECAEFANVILFMTIPNLVYLGRSSVKDFIIKTILVITILSVFYSRSKHTKKEFIAS